MSVKLRFDRGTLELIGVPTAVATSTLPGVLFDPRTHSLRAPAYRLVDLKRALRDAIIDQLPDSMIEPARGQQIIVLASDGA